MSREIADAWRNVADEAKMAARELGTRHGRGAINRVYYALFAAVHAYLLEAGCMPREREGTWRHRELDALVIANLMKRMGSKRTYQLGRLIRRARGLRELADYAPTVHIDESDIARLLTDAERQLESKP